MSHLTKKQLTELKNNLLEEKAELERHFEMEDEGESLNDSVGELSAVDNHPADIGTEVFERSRDMAIDETIGKQLGEVNQALDRIESGDYGTCLTCGEEIPFERLEALPYTAYCVEHTPDREVSDSRPVEENVITRPPAGTGSGRQRAGRFDDADAWKSVESQGNSLSPAMSAKRNVSNYNDLSLNRDEKDGYVEDLEGFVSTDITGKRVSIVRGKAYDNYINSREGDMTLEYDPTDTEDDDQ